MTLSDLQSRWRNRRRIPFGLVAAWATLPLWGPPYLVLWTPYECGRSFWREHIGPVREFSVAKPIPKRRGLRRTISNEALDTVVRSEQTEPLSGFWKLPYEIRLMIWKELLLLEWEGYLEILSRRKKRNALNWSSSNPILYSRARNMTSLYWYECLKHPDPTLLRVSKRFYLEGMDILYSRNQFRMHGEANLSSFARCVAPPRLAQITELRFSVYHEQHKSGRHRRCLTFNSQVWRETCLDLQLFTHLRSLKITLGIEMSRGLEVRCYLDPIWAQKLFHLILEPLTPVTVVEGGEFVVGYRWPKGLCDEWPRGSFEMKYVGSDCSHWWDEKHPIVSQTTVAADEIEW